MARRATEATAAEGRPAKRESRIPPGRKAVLAHVNRDGWLALKALAAENDTTLQALAVEAFNDLLRKHGRKPVA